MFINLYVMKTKAYQILVWLLAITPLSHCKKNGINIPDTNHMQFSIAGQIHNLGNLQSYEVTGNDFQLPSTVISAHNMVPNDPADVGEDMLINIFHTAALKAGDSFTTNDITTVGVQFTYNPSNGVSCTSVPGKQGTVTIIDITPTYVKGTFSVQEFTVTGGTLSQAPTYTIVQGTFYATRDQ